MIRLHEVDRLCELIHILNLILLHIAYAMNYQDQIDFTRVIHILKSLVNISLFLMDCSGRGRLIREALTFKRDHWILLFNYIMLLGIYSLDRFCYWLLQYRFKRLLIIFLRCSIFLRSTSTECEHRLKSVNLSQDCAVKSADP
jgi:hypothetical protein